jgi:hypothetical protein
MNKMNSDFVKYMQSATAISKILGIESVIFDEVGFRGQNQDGIMVLDTDNIPDMDFDAIAIGDINVFSNSINILDNPKIEYELKNNRDGFSFPYRLLVKYKEKRTSIEYRCASPMTIVAPKRLNDPISLTFNLDGDSLELLNKSKNVMGSENVYLKYHNGVLSFETDDINSNTFKHIITKNVEFSEDDFDFNFPYKFKNILSTLSYAKRKSDDGVIEVSITKRGFMKVMIDNIPVYILREKFEG